MKCFGDDASTRVFFFPLSLVFSLLTDCCCISIWPLCCYFDCRGSKQLPIHSNLRATPLLFRRKTNDIKTCRGSCCRPSESSALSNQILFFCFKVVSAALTQFESWFGSVFIAACLPPPLCSSGLRSVSRRHRPATSCISARTCLVCAVTHSHFPNVCV